MPDERKICGDCGLPIALCNAIASWRLSVDRFKRGQQDHAKEFATEAEQYYQAWRAASRS